MSDYKSCGNCGDHSCYETMKKFPELDLTTPCDDWSKLPCPKCGGALSVIHGHNNKLYRHCYSCNFDIEEVSE